MEKNYVDTYNPVNFQLINPLVWKMDCELCGYKQDYEVDKDEVEKTQIKYILKDNRGRKRFSGRATSILNNWIIINKKYYPTENEITNLVKLLDGELTITQVFCWFTN